MRIGLLKVTMVAAILTFGGSPYAEIIELPNEGDLSGFHSGDAYRGQTFFSPEGLAKKITFYFSTVDPQNPGLHLLITKIDDEDEVNPTTVLFESGNIELPVSTGFAEPVTVNLGGIPLRAGQKYAWILDSFVTENGEFWSGNNGMAFSNPDPDGEFIRINLGPFPSGTRAEHFQRDWTSFVVSDMSFSLTITTILDVDHFKCYEAKGDKVDVTVSLEDQFGLESEVRVKRPRLFCNPVTKTVNGEVTTIRDPTAHQTGYKIDSDDRVRRRVVVSNQFGDAQVLSVRKAKLLFVPTEKDGVPSELNVDHFKCYQARGNKIRMTVSLEDQFGLEPEVRVRRPKLFCNPVDKNGEDIINPVSHLTCYRIRARNDNDERIVSIFNQLDAQSLEVEESKLLCVPSEKISYEVGRR